jgi:23S rRNA pseudouridine955/2504/2580 synthase
MSAKIVVITDAHAGQRIDNFLLTQLKGVPKSRIYRAIRSGEVRVDSGRIKQTYRIKQGDKVRIPPISARAEAPKSATDSNVKFIEDCIIFEDKNFIIVNKPANLPVHGGTGVSGGLIERIKLLRPVCKYLNLAHRLDRATSGCIVIAKKRSALVKIQEQLTDRTARKQYLCLVQGAWSGGARTIKLPLKKNQQTSGERHVVVHESGKPCHSVFSPIQKFANATLLLVTLKTGRTHQIRVHAAASGFPIAGDEKYGDEDFNNQMAKLGLRRMFLHSASISFDDASAEKIGICAPLDPKLQKFLKNL